MSNWQHNFACYFAIWKRTFLLLLFTFLTTVYMLSQTNCNKTHVDKDLVYYHCYPWLNISNNKYHYVHRNHTNARFPNWHLTLKWPWNDLKMTSGIILKNGDTYDVFEPNWNWTNSTSLEAKEKTTVLRVKFALWNLQKKMEPLVRKLAPSEYALDQHCLNFAFLNRKQPWHTFKVQTCQLFSVSMAFKRQTRLYWLYFYILFKR